MKKLLIFALFLLSTMFAFAQDTLVYKNGEQRIVKILEVGIDEVKYRSFYTENAPVNVVLKTDIKKILYADGTAVVMEVDPLDLTPTAEGIKKTKAIKIEFFSPLTNDLAFAFEHLVKKGIAIEYKIGIIGVGFSQNNNNDNYSGYYNYSETVEKASGLFIKAGVKFMNSPDYYQRGLKRTHPLRGGYIKPEIIFNKFDINTKITTTTNSTSYGPAPTYTPIYSQNTQTENYKATFTNFAVNIIFGKQRILSEIMALDYYIGIGYGGQSQNGKVGPNSIDDNNFRPYSFSHLYLGQDFPMIISGGLTLGILL